MTPALLICAALVMSDGDSGRCGDVRIRLAGVDAGELAPHTRCRQRPEVWACSTVAHAHAQEARNLARMLAGQGARCRDTGERSWNRVVAVCYANGRDIGAEVVRAGLAIADPRYGAAYRDEEAEARRARRGVWR